MSYREFGGFFGLEARRSGSLHAAAKAFSTASGALGHFLRSLGDSSSIETIWMPGFLCPRVETAIAQAAPKIMIQRYRLRQDLDPFGCDCGPRDLFYSYNVFGLKGAVTQSLPGNTIVDNAHAFFQPPGSNRATFYSARKFFGVPDGAYLYCEDPIDVPPPLSSHRCDHLLRRIELGPQAAYDDFLAAERELEAMPPMGMSALARHVLDGIDYDSVRRSRLANFGFLHHALGPGNELAEVIDLALSDPHFVPFSYPFLSAEIIDLRRTLIARRIYVPHLWQGLSSRPELTEFERHLADDTAHFPIDQRYRVADMDEMLSQAGFRV